MAITLRSRNRFNTVGKRTADPSFARRTGEQVQRLGSAVGEFGEMLMRTQKSIDASNIALAKDYAENFARQVAQDAEAKAVIEAKKTGVTATEAFDTLVDERMGAYTEANPEYAEYTKAAMKGRVLDTRGRLRIKDTEMQVKGIEDKINAMYSGVSQEVFNQPQILDEAVKNLDATLKPHIDSGFITAEGASAVKAAAQEDYIMSAVRGSADKRKRGEAEDIITKYSNIIDPAKAKKEADRVYQASVSRSIQEITLADKEDARMYRENYYNLSQTITGELAKSTNATSISQLMDTAKKDLFNGKLDPSSFNKLQMLSDDAVVRIDNDTSAKLAKAWVADGKSQNDMVKLINNYHLAKGELSSKAADEWIRRVREGDASRSKYTPEDKKAAEAFLLAQIGNEESLMNLMAGDPRIQDRSILALAREKIAMNVSSGKYSTLLDAYKASVSEVLSPTDIRSYIRHVPKEIQGTDMDNIDTYKSVKYIESQFKSGLLTPQERIEALYDIQWKQKMQYIKKWSNDSKSSVESELKATETIQQFSNPYQTPRIK